MQLTPNFRLRKPDGTDPVDVQDFNDNADVIDTNLAGKLDKTGDASNAVTKFTQAGSRTNLLSGEKLSVSFGKIMKWFVDLKDVAFSGRYSDLTDRPTIPAGGIADKSKIIDNLDDIAANTQTGYMAGALAVKELNQNLGGYKFDIIDGIPSYKAGADAAWVPFSNPEVYFAQYSFPGDQSTIPFTLSKAQLWLLTNGNWFTQYQNQLKLQINGATVPVASYTKYNNCYIAKFDTKQYINSAASLVVNRSMVVANTYTYIMLIGV